ncbi:uncharacterized protein LOC132301032 [Cornus florida]|uniref:uncharacterized protein LOC132301032 n=1 Tax=Cornus florida TaxID=4283 RepID=UPI0028967DFF|nr:uncharacterized protein LOC132301032 [Cornus florida]
MAHTLAYFSPLSPIFPWYKVVWFKHHKPKNSLILWLAARGRLYTLDAKPMLYKHYTNRCYLCHTAWEPIDHLFFKCDYTSHIWRFIQESIGFYILRNSWADLLLWCSIHWASTQFLLHKLLWSAAVYFIWIERNARAFRNQSSTAHSIIAQIKSCVRSRLASLKLKSSSELRLISSPSQLQTLFQQGCSTSNGYL